jgi:hypothetical protein
MPEDGAARIYSEGARWELRRPALLVARWKEGLSLFVVDAFSSQAFLAATYGSHFSAATDGMDKEKARAAFSQQAAVN